MSSYFKFDKDGYVEVYSDGCCLRNGKHNSQAGLGVFFSRDCQLNLSERVDGLQTNQNAEVMAAVRAFELAKRAGFNRVHLYTDSKFVYNGIGEWMIKWKKNGWSRMNGQPLANYDSWKQLDKAMEGMSVYCSHVAAHAGNPGNGMADSLAKRGAEMELRR